MIFYRISESMLAKLIQRYDKKNIIFQEQETNWNFTCYQAPQFIITKTRLFKYIENFTSKNWKISDENSDICHIFAQNVDYGYSLEQPRRSSSNEYPQSMFLSKNKKNNVYPCKPQFYFIKVGMLSWRIVLIPYINLLNLSWRIKCLFLRNMEPLWVTA